MCAVLRQPKSVKLRALHSECKFGVAARSCKELLHKGCVRFQVGRGGGAGTPATKCTVSVPLDGLGRALGSCRQVTP